MFAEVEMCRICGTEVRDFNFSLFGGGLQMFARIAASLTFLSLVVVLSPLARSSDMARTGQLPVALDAVGVGADDIVTETEAEQVRGQFFLGGDGASVLGRAVDIYQRATVVQLPGGISYFAGTFFGEGVLINQNEGRGAIFVPDNPSAGTLFFSNLMGDYSVQRMPDGTTAIVTPGLW